MGKDQAEGNKYKQMKDQASIAVIHAPVIIRCGPEIE